MRLTALLLLTACSSTPADDAPTAAVDGAKTYAMACARCHGAKGLGDGQLAGRMGPVPKLNRAMPHEYVVEIVTRGKGAMPPHAERLSAADIGAVADHVATLAK